MTPAWATVVVAALGVIQVLGLALIALRQNTMRKNLDGHLSKLEDQRATRAEVAARPPLPRRRPR